MPVSSITIKTHSGATVNLSGGCVFTSGTDTQWTAVNGTAMLSMLPQASLFDHAYDAVISQRYVSRLNNVAAGEDGAIWVLPDRCMSTRPAQAVAKLQKTVPSSPSAIYDWEYTQQPWGTGMTIYDTCPACRNCRDVALIKRQFEWVKMMLNMFKDVNINLNPANYAEGGSDTVYMLRQQYLSSNRIALDSACTSEIGSSADKYASIPEMKGSPLMNEYISTVHMWNFAVSRNNTSTEIRPTEESSTGFLVQTKHALPSCSEQLRLTCDIHVEPAPSGTPGTSLVEPNLSMLVTGTSTQFAPFDVAASASGVPGNLATLTLESYVEKNVHVDFPAARIAGTYILVAKFIPFINTTLLDDEGNPIPLSGNTMWIVPESTATSSTVTSDSTVTYSSTFILVGGSTTAISSSSSPSVADYTQAGEFPSRSGEGFNIWQITVTWTIQRRSSGSWTTFKSYVSTYLFSACRTRQPIDGLIRDTIWTQSSVSSAATT